MQHEFGQLGKKKTPAQIDKLQAFLLDETRDAFGLVVSIDMLLYGGIVPSRLHRETEDTLKKRLDILRQIKKINPKIKIFAFDLIMRCPQYSSSDEEPDYYEVCGREIFLSGYIQNRIELGVATEEEKNRLPGILEKIKPEYLEDFLHRRGLNLKLNLTSLDLIKENIIDFLIFPQECQELINKKSNRRPEKMIIKKTFISIMLLFL